jgi:hypothetical protein
MLNLDNPQTKHIFRAAAIQDRIREHLVKIETSNNADATVRYQEIVDSIIAELRNLNDEH